ncbi:uncharacterized protein DS421_6g175380 [Arachis hypogaea]|nr:uncharacterized protein DS421_6g175380 [Arachis hypogaea]
MEELHCNIVVTKQSQLKLLRLNLNVYSRDFGFFLWFNRCFLLEVFSNLKTFAPFTSLHRLATLCP